MQDAHRAAGRAEAQKAAVVVVTRHGAARLVVCAVHHQERALDDLEDVAEADALRRPRQPVAAAQPAHRLEQLPPGQALEQVGHHGLVEARVLGELVRADHVGGAKGPVPGQVAHQEDGVVSLLGDPEHAR